MYGLVRSRLGLGWLVGSVLFAGAGLDGYVSLSTSCSIVPALSLSTVLPGVQYGCVWSLLVALVSLVLRGVLVGLASSAGLSLLLVCGIAAGMLVLVCSCIVRFAVPCTWVLYGIVHLSCS